MIFVAGEVALDVAEGAFHAQSGAERMHGFMYLLGLEELQVLENVRRRLATNGRRAWRRGLWRLGAQREHHQHRE
jgi:hypothetical protein